jgi:hypothetical protein
MDADPRPGRIGLAAAWYESQRLVAVGEQIARTGRLIWLRTVEILHRSDELVRTSQLRRAGGSLARLVAMSVTGASIDNPRGPPRRVGCESSRK